MKRMLSFGVISHYSYLSAYMNARILDEALKIVKRLGSSSFLGASFNAADRDFEITMLQNRLSDSQRSITVSGCLRSQEVVTHSKSSATSKHRYIKRSEPICHPYISLLV